MKRNDLFLKFRQNIISGIWREGDKIPTELEFTQQFNVSRDTVRNALKLLENGGYIERQKSRGTFIRIPDISPDCRTISLLVPCVEYLHCLDCHFQSLLFELIAEAAKIGWRVVPTIFSRTNINTDIWWDNLAHINGESRIVINRAWFAPYFPTLKRLHPHIAFITNDSTPPAPYQALYDSWQLFIENDTSAGELAAERLASQGCKKVLLAFPQARQADNTIVSGCLARARQLKMECQVLDLQFDSPQSLCQQVAKAFKAGHCNGLFCHINELAIPGDCTLRQALGLNDSTPLVTVPLKSTALYGTQTAQNLSCVEYPLRKMAEDIVKYLSESHYLPGKRIYTPTLAEK